MADEHKDHLLEHAYDGIQEFDNPLPTWWKLIFYVTILVAPLYIWDPLGIGVGPGKEKAYQQQLAAFEAAHPKPAESYSDEQVAAFAQDPTRVDAGKVVYTSYCVPCHRPDGGGLIGPNLTDDYWIHGGRPTEIMKTVTEGVLAKGMPNWGKMLKAEQVEDVVGYVQTLHGTNPVNPKEPQGTRSSPDSAGAAPSGLTSPPAKKGT